LFPPPFTVVVVVVHPGLPLQVLVLPPCEVVVVVVNPFLFPSANAALEANANEPASRRAEINPVIDRVMEFILC
jgi:hypothetical protein